MDLILTIKQRSEQVESLLQKQPKQQKHQMRFSQKGGTIGRGGVCDWRIKDAKRLISTVHACIEYANHQYILFDKSTNGLFVNGAQAALGEQGYHIMATGDTIRMGDVELMVAIESGDPALAVPFDELFDREEMSVTALVGSDQDEHDLSFMQYKVTQNQRAELLVDNQTEHQAAHLAENRAEKRSRRPILVADDFYDESMIGQSILDPVKALGGSEDSVVGAMNLMNTQANISHAFGHVDCAPIHEPMPQLHFESRDSELLIPENWDKSQIAMKPVQTAVSADEVSMDALIIDQASIDETSIDEANIEETMTGGVKSVLQREHESDHEIDHQRESQNQNPDKNSNKHQREMDHLFKSIGIDPVVMAAQEREAVILELANVIKQSVGGLMSALSERSMMKNRCRADMTLVAARENNPLKFSATPEEAINNLLSVSSRKGYLQGTDAIEEAFKDLQSHQNSLLVGLSRAHQERASAILPHQVKRLFEQSGKRSLFKSEKECLWALYEMRAKEYIAASWEIGDILSEPGFAEGYGESSAKF